MSDMAKYYDEMWDRAFAMLEGQAHETTAQAKETTELLLDCRERLSKKLREMSVTKDFAVSGDAGVSKTLVDIAGNGAGVSAKVLRNHVADVTDASPEVLEAERKHYGRQHRLRLEADERWPEEE